MSHYVNDSTKEVKGFPFSGARPMSTPEWELYKSRPMSEEQLAQQAQSEMITELNWCDLQLKYHATGDTKRAISTTELINAYAVECRDYVQNVDGVLTIVGDKPERPE